MNNNLIHYVAMMGGTLFILNGLSQETWVQQISGEPAMGIPLTSIESYTIGGAIFLGYAMFLSKKKG